MWVGEKGGASGESVGGVVIVIGGGVVHVGDGGVVDVVVAGVIVEEAWVLRGRPRP